MRTIWRDPEILVFTTEDLGTARADLNVDVEVRDEFGRWSATFFTLENLKSLFVTNSRTGECAEGLYLWAADMIVVRELTEATVVRTVEDLRKTGEFQRAFRLLDD